VAGRRHTPVGGWTRCNVVKLAIASSALWPAYCARAALRLGPIYRAGYKLCLRVNLGCGLARWVRLAVGVLPPD